VGANTKLPPAGRQGARYRGRQRAGVVPVVGADHAADVMLDRRTPRNAQFADEIVPDDGSELAAQQFLAVIETQRIGPVARPCGNRR
jgi:hypothetical protein